MKTIYLDHAAGTPIAKDVLASMLPYFGASYGNPSSLHASGRRAHVALEDARARVAACIGAKPHEIIFTSSGTESGCLALLGAARANAARGKHIIVSATEHKAVLAAAKLLQTEGFEVSFAPVDTQGVLDINAFRALVRDDTILVSVMYANNEVGTVARLAEIRRTLPAHVLLHSDACQVAGYLPINVSELGVDLLSLNGAKIYGPKGIGVLYKKESLRLTPLVVGGDQEGRLRAGTESLPLIIGMAHALEKAERLREAEHARLWNLREYFIAELTAKIPDLHVNGHPTDTLPHIVHVTVPGIEGESMLLMLDAEGIEVATGSACSAHDLTPSHVLTALGHDPEIIHGSIRFSFGRNTTRDDLAHVLVVFQKIVSTLRLLSTMTLTKYATKK